MQRGSRIYSSFGKRVSRNKAEGAREQTDNNSLRGIIITDNRQLIYGEELMRDTDIPMLFPYDNVMAPRQEIDWLIQWAREAFGGEPMAASGADNSLLKQARFPFSFKYDGIKSNAFLCEWKHTCKCNDVDDKLLLDAQWADTKTGLVVRASVKVF